MKQVVGWVLAVMQMEVMVIGSSSGASRPIGREHACPW